MIYLLIILLFMQADESVKQDAGLIAANAESTKNVVVEVANARV